jgi:hypothetical protein
MGCWHSAPAWCVHQPFPKPYWLAHACVASLPCLLADPGGAAGADAEGAVKQENVPRLAAVADHLALAQAMGASGGRWCVGFHCLAVPALNVSVPASPVSLSQPPLSASALTGGGRPPWCVLAPSW